MVVYLGFLSVSYPSVQNLSTVIVYTVSASSFDYVDYTV